MSYIYIYSSIKLLRIRQWIKNFFVFAPLFFSLKFFDFLSVKSTCNAFFFFCFLSSCVYIINDIVDREKDAKHPKKKNRPLASGVLSVKDALFLLFFCIIIVVCFLMAINNLKVMFVGILYLLVNLLYSFLLKHIVIVDVIVISLGFILRVYAGAYVIDVTVSSYIFMTTLFLTLFLGFSKRKMELLKQGAEARSVLRFYSIEAINQYITICSALTIISYALYVLDPSTIVRFDTNRLIYSLFFVIYGIFKYIYLINNDEIIEDPTDAVYSDKILMCVCLSYVAYIVLILCKII